MSHIFVSRMYVNNIYWIKQIMLCIYIEWKERFINEYNRGRKVMNISSCSYSGMFQLCCTVWCVAVNFTYAACVNSPKAPSWQCEKDTYRNTHTIKHKTQFQFGFIGSICVCFLWFPVLLWLQFLETDLMKKKGC